MFDSLVAAALGNRGVAAVGAWARVENASCARRLFATADELERMWAADGSEEREQWCLDNWAAVAASVAAAQNVSLGVASHQLLIATELRERLPRVAEVFAAGTINYRLISAIVARTRLVSDPEAMAKVDIEIAARIHEWGVLSAEKTDAAIDVWVDRYDPAAVRRTEYAARGCHADVHKPQDGTGTASLDAVLLASDGDALDQRLDAIAATVCDNDPRTLDQRRSAALGALGHRADRLACLCENPDCDAKDATPSTVVVHVIAREESLTDDTPVQLDGTATPEINGKPLSEITIKEAFSPQPPQPTVIAHTPPAALLSGGMLPAPLLAAKVAGIAKIVPIVHPGDAPPEPRYIPSAVLATFVRCRDMTCRFPGCDEPAHRCDIDHTLAYPNGPTQASNLKVLCRKHHLLKTFWGWQDQQLPDGTVIWTCPQGQTYTTHPGSRLLFPTLCRPTAPVTVVHSDTPHTAARGLAMPRRTTTRAQNRAQAIKDERQFNQTLLQTQAEQRAREQEQSQKPRTDCESAYFPTRPPPPGDDPPPF
ncbi:DUF222 domain-containing protein [Mycobacterium sp. NPDC051804]|uniref:HNH endonuclease signature motif containing protein n=1 Tax=Mycobacterium sp. NPDC051804 TaxID=3364295 RepID=UPI0037978D1F